VKQQVIVLRVEGEERQEGAVHTVEGMQEGGREICGVNGEAPPVRGCIEAATAVDLSSRVRQHDAWGLGE
jgi:hypothetical protein